MPLPHLEQTWVGLVLACAFVEVAAGVVEGLGVRDGEWGFRGLMRGVIGSCICSCAGRSGSVGMWLRGMKRVRWGVLSPRLLLVSVVSSLYADG